MKLAYEIFQDRKSFLKTITERPNNSIMINENSSTETGSSKEKFTGTKNWEEALKFYKFGVEEYLPKIKKGIKTNQKIIRKYTDKNRLKVSNEIVGFIPNVPNSILNVPESMIQFSLNKEKERVLDIIYIMDGACCEETEFFIKGGITVVSIINLIETLGIRTRLHVSPYCGAGSNQFAMTLVKVKDYQERFNLQKLTYPLIHPSMFRRMGFKWLETFPNLTDSRFRGGYGHVPDLEELKDIFEKDCPEAKKKFKSTIFFNPEILRKKEYDIEKIIEDILTK